MSSECNFVVTSSNGYVPAAALKSRARPQRPPIDLRESVGVLGYEMDFARLWAEMHDLYGPSDWGWFPIAGGKYERRHGAQWPFFRTEQELDLMRSASRFVAGWNNGHGAGFVGGLCAYAIGKGMVCKPSPRDRTNDPYDARLCAMVGDVIEEFAERVLWNELQQQIFNESHIDGDYFLWLFDLGDSLDVRKVFPEYLRTPLGQPFDEWGFGIHTPADDRERVLAYWVNDEDTTSGQVVSVADMIHVPFFRPGGWTRGIKRGMPLFAHGVKEAFDSAGKVLRNMGEGTAIRQAFAYIEEQAEGTSRDDAADFVSSNADVEIQRPYGDSRTHKITKTQPGYVPKISAGYKYQPPPAHPETQAAIEVVDALLRNAVAVMNAPEWLASGNARNMGAYASSMVAESPFVKRMEQVQEYYGGRFLRVLRRVVEIAVRSGRLPRECLTRVRLTMEPPSLITRDKSAEASMNQLYIGMGVKSVQQVQQELGLDSDKQRSEISEFNRWKAAEAAKAAPPGAEVKPGETQPLTPGIGDDDPDPMGEVKESRAAVMESTWTPFTGPRGGKGWKSASGVIHYGEHPPEPGETLDKTDDGKADAKPDTANDEVKTKTKKREITIEQLPDQELFKRSGQQFENIQLALGLKRPVMGPAGAEAVRKALSKLPGGAVITELLKVDGSQTSYDRNGFAERGNDAYTNALDGKFTGQELKDASDWLYDKFNNAKELANVNQHRWLRGAVMATRPSDAAPPENTSTAPASDLPHVADLYDRAGRDHATMPVEQIEAAVAELAKQPKEVVAKVIRDMGFSPLGSKTKMVADMRQRILDRRSAAQRAAMIEESRQPADIHEDSQWTAFTGPKGGKGWKNAAGTVHYGDKPPAAGETPDSTDDGKADTDKTAKTALTIAPQQPMRGDEKPVVRFGPDSNVIEGEIAGLPITTLERGIIGKMSKKTQDELAAVFSDPEILQAVKSVGIKNIRVEAKKGPGKPANWTAAYNDGTLIIHPRTAEEIASSQVPERAKGGLARVIHHEAGHAEWESLPKEQAQAFVKAVEANPQVVAQIGRIVNIKPPRDAFDYDEKARAASEVYAETRAMRKYAPDLFAQLPPEIQATDR